MLEQGQGEQLRAYRAHLTEEEKRPLTIEKYVHEAGCLYAWLDGAALCREKALEYKQYLTRRYKATSANSAIAALNSYFRYIGRPELLLKPLKVQRRIFSQPERDLSRGEYHRLLEAARRTSERLCLVMQTICATGIRVSELEYITVRAVRAGQAEVYGKGKQRVIFIVRKLQKQLLQYARRHGITDGSIFVTRSGRPLSRHNIWAEMKALCTRAGVDRRKVFPHNLRHLFARCFYAAEKDLGKLADVLGHSNINTTRIYTMECGAKHEKVLKGLRLLL